MGELLRRGAGRRRLGGASPRGSGLSLSGFRRALVALALLVATLVAYGEVGEAGFLIYDDDLYVTGNPRVRAGLTAEGFTWALTAFEAQNWHPLTWLSHMLDVELHGLDPAGHHWSSLILHTLNSLLLFLVLESMTRSVWRSGFVAALFALHPLHVESVAWVAERKDVLSALFWLLTMAAYVHHARRPGPARYLIVSVTFALGLAAKPMLVTLPFALLLLDIWPLNRVLWRGASPSGAPAAFRATTPGRLLLEKLPLLALSLASAALTLAAQRAGGAMVSLATTPPAERLTNAAASYGSYLWKMVWPSPLVVFYPHRGDLPLPALLATLVLLAVITALAVLTARSRPYLVVGWLWYLGTLVPVIGFVQVGWQGMADRYTYLPLLGPFLMVSWGAAEAWGRLRLPTAWLAAAALIALAGLLAATRSQVRHWTDSVTLFHHAAEAVPGNAVAEHFLGLALDERGDAAGAIERYRRALEFLPDYADAHNNLGAALAAEGRLGEATSHWQEAIRISPRHSRAHNNLGMARYRAGRIDEAITLFRRAIDLDPGNILARNNLAAALAGLGRSEEAIAGLSEAAALAPEDVTTRYNLGVTLSRAGRYAEALLHLREAVRLQPDHQDARRQIEAVLAREGAGAGAPP